MARVTILFTVLAGIACSSPAAPAQGNLTVTRFNSGSSSFAVFSGFTQPMTSVIRDDAAWQAFWRTLYSGQSPAPPLPAVDFSSEMVVAAAMGTQPTSGYDIIVQSANESGDVVTIETRELRPGPKCATLTVLTSPVDLARVPRRTGSVTFHSTEGINNCGTLAR